MGLVHIGLDLEDEGGELGGEGVDLPAIGVPVQGRRGHAKELLQEGLHAEVGQGGAEEHGAQGPRADGLHVKIPARAQQLHLLPEGLPAGLADIVGGSGVLQVHLYGGGLLAPALGGEKEDAGLLPVVDPLELLAAADGPVDGVGVDAQLPLHLLAEGERVLGLPVHLVDEGENGNVAHGADLEQLPGLGLHALGPVNDHHGGVRRHEGAVGVLGEILVARGVQDVDAIAVVLELHDGAGDGNAPLLLDLHPVAGGGAGPLALDLPGLGDGPAVEEEFFRQGGFARIRVGDDGEGPSSCNFFL